MAHGNPSPHCHLGGIGDNWHGEGLSCHHGVSPCHINNNAWQRIATMRASPNPEDYCGVFLGPHGKKALEINPYVSFLFKPQGRMATIYAASAFCSIYLIILTNSIPLFFWEKNTSLSIPKSCCNWKCITQVKGMVFDFGIFCVHLFSKSRADISCGHCRSCQTWFIFPALHYAKKTNSIFKWLPFQRATLK